jgi:hypothetical protein
MAKIIAIDFDGVLHRYTSPFGDGVPRDKPVPGALEMVTALRERGYQCVVFTARTDIGAVSQWLLANGFPALRVTTDKAKTGASLFVDDRAIRFDGRAKSVLDHVDRDPHLGTWLKPNKAITPRRARAFLDRIRRR